MWIAYSALMFVASVALYLTVRKSSLLEVPTPFTNLAMFAVPLLIYAGIGIGQQHHWSISTANLCILFVAAVVFAYGGNTVSLKAISVAPNPGYSLVLSKSYVLFTTIVAVLLLGAQLSVIKGIAILIIVGFSVLVMTSKEQEQQETTHRWVLLSFGAFFAWGMLSLSSKYLFSHGTDTMVFLVLLFAIVTACIVTANFRTLRDTTSVPRGGWWLLLSTGICAALFNLGQFEAIRYAPNVGYVNAINAGSIALVTILAVLLFGDELTKRKAVGVFGVTIGLLLLLIAP